MHSRIKFLRRRRITPFLLMMPIPILELVMIMDANLATNYAHFDTKIRKPCRPRSSERLMKRNASTWLSA